MYDHRQLVKFIDHNQSFYPLKSKAFTLIELVMVIILLGILAGVVGPRFFSLSAYHEKFYIQDFLSALRYSRLTAEVSNCRVQFNLQANGFDLKQNQNCNQIPPSNNFIFTVKRPSDPSQAYASTEKPASMTVTVVDSANTSSNTFYILPSGRVTNGAGAASDIIISFTGNEVSANSRLEQSSGYVQ